MTLATVAITNAIDDISISGVSIKNLSNIPEAVTPNDCPILFPDPRSFISGVSVEWDSYGTDALANKHITYNLTYTFCFEPIGAGRGMLDIFDPWMDAVLAIMDGFIAASLTFNSVGGVEVNLQEVTPFGVIQDLAGNQFHGCQFVLQVIEFIN